MGTYLSDMDRQPDIKLPRKHHPEPSKTKPGASSRFIKNNDGVTEPTDLSAFQLTHADDVS
jgi:hypothetical protein